MLSEQWANGQRIRALWHLYCHEVMRLARLRWMIFSLKLNRGTVHPYPKWRETFSNILWVAIELLVCVIQLSLPDLLVLFEFVIKIRCSVKSLFLFKNL
jgi:hypothetical protein